MTGRDAIGIACVLWPGLRTPLAVADFLAAALPAVRVDDAGQLEVGDDVRAGVGVDWSSFGLALLVDTPHPDDPGAYPVLGLRVAVGPVGAWVEYDPTPRADDGLRAWAEARWAA